MKMQKKTIDDALFVELMEDISYENSMELESFITSNISKSLKKVIVNLRNVKYINSFALGTLIKTMQNIEKMGYSFYLKDIQPDVKKLLDITGIMDKFKYHE